MTDYISYFNGEWVPLSQVRIDPDDRGFTTGDVVFDVARTFNGKTFRLNYHIDRLYRSLQYARMDPGLSPEEMYAISEEVVARNEASRAEVGDYYIRQFVTRGKGIWAHSAGPPSVCVRVSPIDLGRYAPAYSEGLHAVIARTRSYSPESLDSKIKHQSRNELRACGDRGGGCGPGGLAAADRPRRQHHRGHVQQCVHRNRRRDTHARRQHNLARWLAQHGA